MPSGNTEVSAAIVLVAVPTEAPHVNAVGLEHSIFSSKSVPPPQAAGQELAGGLVICAG